MPDDLASRLEREYCPPLDSSLFLAIISDYDLNDNFANDEVRSILDALKTGAEAEESTAFDPSGSSNFHDNTSDRDTPERARSWNGDALSRTEDTDLTSLSYSAKSLTFSDEQDGEDYGRREQHDDTFLETLPPAEKEALLAEMFPDLKPFSINFTLKKCQGNFRRTVEELLNHVFFLDDYNSDGEPQQQPKGIDAFINSPTPRKGRTKGKRRKKTALIRRSSSTPAPLNERCARNPTSKWAQVQEDVDFIAQRTYLPSKTIASTYHKCNASLPATIVAICTASPTTNPHIAFTDPIIDLHAIQLSTDFPSLSPEHLKALIYLTHPSTASAHELAKAMTSSLPAGPSIQVIPQYSPPDLDDSSQSTVNFTSPTQNLTMSHTTASTLATAYNTARDTALTQATAAYRKSRSQPLMGGAASYYSSVGRDAASSAQKYNAAAAEALVTNQSKPGEVDLHGVTVKDAVRIARQKVEGWWEGGQREWARMGKVQGDGGFRVVTGVGRHSEGGRGKLGPAVGAMLVREGWRVEVGEGVLTVRGKVRR